jgi:bifunctional non-homologous end joining protein LigD
MNKKAKTLQDKIETKIINFGKVSMELTHLNKLFWPAEHITKSDLIEYYLKIYPYIIPYLKDRPQSLRRNPNGISDDGFFQKDTKNIAPDWAKTIELYSESAKKEIHYFLCNDKASLLFLVNIGCIELNPWNSCIQTIDFPDYCILDLDPGNKNTFDEVIEVAQAIRQITYKAGIASYCKTSGATGMHIYFPLGAKYSYEECRAFALLMANVIVKKLPRLTTTERSLSKRSDNKIYIDYLQNKKGQTLASVYSVRPKPHACVSTALEWDEVKTGIRPEQFTINNVLVRLEKKGDLFKPVLGKGIDLKKASITLGGY